jgi:hypothetical protein
VEDRRDQANSEPPHGFVVRTPSGRSINRAWKARGFTGRPHPADEVIVPRRGRSAAPPVGVWGRSATTAGFRCGHRQGEVLCPFLDTNRRTLTYELTPSGRTPPTAAVEVRRELASANGEDSHDPVAITSCTRNPAASRRIGTRPTGQLALSEVTVYRRQPGKPGKRGRGRAEPNSRFPLRHPRGSFLWRGG